MTLLMSGCKEDQKTSETVETTKNTASATIEVSGKSDTKTGSKITAKENKKMAKTMTIKLKDGEVQIKLFPDIAPKHVERMETLANKGFYNGLKFHRVIEGFMAQTGDPKGNGTGGSSLPDLHSEFSAKPFDRGVLGMARSASPHSANSQFFIMLNEGHFLNNQYTVFGEVTSGMEFVDKIKLGDKAANGSVTDPDTMVSVTVQ